MAEQQHQQQDFRQGLQHLAHLRQEASATPAVLIHQHQYQQGSELSRWAAEAALEAHLQQQAALVAVQDLERQRLQL